MQLRFPSFLVYYCVQFGLRGETMDYFLEWSFAIFIKKIGYIFGWFDFYLYFCGVNKRPLSIYRHGGSIVF